MLFRETVDSTFIHLLLYIIHISFVNTLQIKHYRFVRFAQFLAPENDIIDMIEALFFYLSSNHGQRKVKNAKKRRKYLQSNYGRWEGRYISSYTPDFKSRYRSVYGRSYSEVKDKLHIFFLYNSQIWHLYKVYFAQRKTGSV